MPPTKDNSRNVRNTEARKRLAGLREIRLWVPDKPECVEAHRRLAEEQREGIKQHALPSPLR